MRSPVRDRFGAMGSSALNSLDDDGDGKLTGRELESRFDHNSDGKSKCGEVLTVQDLRVAEIATVASARTEFISRSRAASRSPIVTWFRVGTAW
jgi:hypothetical protein